MPSVPTVTVPLVGWVLMTIELRLIAAVPAVSLLARLMVAEALLASEAASATAVGGVWVDVTVTATLAGAEVRPLMSLIV